MVISELVGKAVYLDTAPLIYFIEGNNQYHGKLLPLFQENAHILFITSTITLLELLVKPLRDGDKFIAQQYRAIITTSSTLELVEISAAIAEKAAELRAKYNIRTPDSIQLATAILHRADIFLTNDRDLKRVSELRIVTLDEIQ